MSLAAVDLLYFTGCAKFGMYPKKQAIYMLCALNSTIIFESILAGIEYSNNCKAYSKLNEFERLIGVCLGDEEFRLDDEEIEDVSFINEKDFYRFKVYTSDGTEYVEQVYNGNYSFKIKPKYQDEIDITDDIIKITNKKTKTK